MGDASDRVDRVEDAAVSQGGTKKGQTTAVQRELTKRLEVLRPGQHDVFLVRVPQEYFDDPVASEAMSGFAEFIQKTAKRPVLIVTEGKEDVALADLAEKLVEARRRMGLEQPPQIAVPRPKIHLPGGVQI
jgi:hypothetical protein